MFHFNKQETRFPNSVIYTNLQLKNLNFSNVIRTIKPYTATVQKYRFGNKSLIPVALGAIYAYIYSDLINKKIMYVMSTVWKSAKCFFTVNLKTGKSNFERKRKFWPINLNITTRCLSSMNLTSFHPMTLWLIYNN